MKEYRNILIAFALVLICNLGFSNTFTGEQIPTDQEQQQEGERKRNQTIMNPDGDELGTSEIEEDYSEEGTREPIEESSSTKTEPKDSVDDESVSKYNFIFYLLYKFKYDTAP